MSLRQLFTSTASRFARNRDGGVAVTFALSSIAVIGAAGCAVDYSKAAVSHSRVQDVADIASLAAAQSSEDDPAELQAIADEVFLRHFGTDSGVEITNIVKTADAVTVNARTSVPTTLTRVFGQEKIEVAVESTSVFAVSALDMALVLDTTSSMRGQKLADLQRAAGELVDTIEELDDDRVRLSVVPFTNHVNVGEGRRNAAWLDVPEDEEQTRWVRVEGTARNCRNESGTWNDDGIEREWSGEVCDYDYEEETVTVSWQGCVGSRNQPQDERAPHAGRDIPGIVGDKCGREVQPLSADMRAVGASINALAVQGRRTYMPAGLLWGWRMLDGAAPFPNASGGLENERILVLMSDGDNTTSKTGELHEGNPASKGAADAKTRRMCEAAKADNVQIYTIAFQIDDAGTRNLLRNCATDPSKNFDAQSAEELTAAFQNIADSVKRLRVTS